MPNFLAINSKPRHFWLGVRICVVLAVTNLGGCYYQKQSIREEAALLPAPLYQDSRHLPVAPGSSAQPVAQYPDWLFDGPEGRGFANYLAQGYRHLAKQEDNQHDFRSAALFLARSSQVELGERVEPEALHQRNLPPYAVSDMLYARHRLVSAFANNAANRYPKISARAQVSFDCWMEQQEENLQPNDVAMCRRDFEDAMFRLETVLTPTAAPKLPNSVADPELIASTSCVPCQSQHIIFFEFDQANLTDTAKKLISELAKTIRKRPTHGVVVSGHTDLAGSRRYNDSLSKKRVDVVVAALIGAGVPSGELAATYAYGETRPRIATPDGERNAGNRRVVVWVPCEPVNAQGMVEPCPYATMQVPPTPIVSKGRREPDTPRYR